MSVLIKGIKMPKNGERLKVWIEANGQVIVDKRTYYEEYEAVELPDHGDLIDRDALEEPVGSYTPIKWTYEYGASIRLEDIDHAPVVIPAERSEDETN